MEIRLERDALADAVAWVARSLPNRPSVPVLAGLLIEATDQEVTLSSFDNTTAAKVALPAEVAESGQALVSGRLLADISRSLPNRPVSIKADTSSAEVVCGSARFSLQTLPVEEYPTLPTMPEVNGTVDADVFEKAVSQVYVAAGRDELMAVFTGIRIEIEGDRLNLLATDRYRMAMKEIRWNPLGKAQDGAALVPGKVLHETAKAMSSGTKITMSLADSESGEGLVGFLGEGGKGSRETVTRLLDGAFPKVRHVMDIQGTVNVRVNTADLLAAVKRVGLVAERNSPLRMQIQDGQIALSAASGDRAQADEAIAAEVEYTTDEPTIQAAGFNPHYLQDALNAIDAPYAKFSFTKQGKPCLITGLEEIDGKPLPDYKHVIMLMRLPMDADGA